MFSTTIRTPPARPRRWQRPISRRTTVGLTVGFVGAALVAFFYAFGISFCGIWGETCSPHEELAMTVLNVTGWVLLVGGPILVAWLRRAVVWALTPVVVAATVAFLAFLVKTF